MKSRLYRLAIYALSTGLGLATLLYPFLIPALIQSGIMGQARANETPLVLTLLLGLCLLVLLYEVQVQGINTRLIALLGILIAINSALRFFALTIPGLAGFSPVFFLIIMTGYAFGGRFGFLMGALTLLVSALVTGGVGPWLPGQMFTAGWMGMSAALCAPPTRWLHLEGKTGELVSLAIFGAVWGLLFGAIMNLWAWPFVTGPTEQYWSAGAGLFEAVRRYGVYYLVTSLGWDLARSAGNVLMILLLGAPTLRALRRFRARFTFEYRSRPTLQAAGEKA